MSRVLRAPTLEYRGGAASRSRSRKVQLSRRLRAALLGLRPLRASPPGTALLFPDIDVSKWRKREAVRILDRAGIGHRAIEDLRDTFASQMLLAGISLQYISKQLGHSKQPVTEAHYARYLPEGDEYRAPARLRRGEVPADLLARLGDLTRQENRESDPDSDPTHSEPIRASD